MKSTTIKLSVIIPIYKSEQYLEKCLDSLVNQSLKEIELICINDGSPDNSLQILQRYHQKYGDKIVIIDKPNEGVWRGRMDGIKKAKGEYIGFLDSDDYVKPGYAKKLYKAVKETEADIVVCGFSRIDLETGNIYSNEMCQKRRDIIIGENTDDLISINTAPWNKIYKTELLKKMSDLKNPPKILEDMMFLLLAYLNTQKISFIEDNLIGYMVRKSSAMNTIGQEQINSTYPAMLEVKKIYQQDERSEIFLPILSAMALLHFGISLMYRASYNKSTFKQIFQTNQVFLDKNFPDWRTNRYTKLSHIIKSKSPNLKFGIISTIYRLNLYKPFLTVYRFMIDKLNRDIKW